VDDDPSGYAFQDRFHIRSTSGWRGERSSGRSTTPLGDGIRSDSFYQERKGSKEPFYHYDPYEPATGQPIGSNYDATGVSIQGRYIVRFEGDFRQNLVLGRHMVNLELVQLA
jgi:hypothetical protein